MTLRSLLTLLATLMAGRAAALEPIGVEVASEALAYAEPVPIRAYARKFHAALGSGSDASAVIRGSIMLGYGRWRVGRIYQDVYAVEASRDAARLYHRISNDLPFSAGETFDVALDVRFTRSLGWRVARVFGAGGFGEVELGLTRWHGLDLTDGTLRASASANEDGSYRYVGSIDYAYDKDALFGRPEYGADGTGYGLDLAWQGQWREWSWQAEGRNLFGFVKWRQALHTSGQFGSATEQVDHQGRSSFNPTLSGREDRRTFRQALPRDGLLRVAYRVGAYEAGVGSRYLPAGSNLVLEAGRRWAPVTVRAGLMVVPEVGAGLELSGYGFTLRYFADALALPDARWLEARLTFAHAF